MNDYFLYCYLVSYQVVRKDKQQGEEENKSANEPTGTSMDYSNMRQTKEQDKVEDDDEFDQVDAAQSMIDQPAPVRIAQLQDRHEDQPAVEEHKRTDSEVPKIEVTLSNSSSDEDSAASEERNMKQSGKEEQDDDDVDGKDELKNEVKKLTSENETLKNTIKNLERDKSSLEENLQEERSKIEVREGTVIIYFLPSNLDD